MSPTVVYSNAMAHRRSGRISLPCFTAVWPSVRGQRGGIASSGGRFSGVPSSSSASTVRRHARLPDLPFWHLSEAHILREFGVGRTSGAVRTVEGELELETPQTQATEGGDSAFFFAMKRTHRTSTVKPKIVASAAFVIYESVVDRRHNSRNDKNPALIDEA